MDRNSRVADGTALAVSALALAVAIVTGLQLQAAGERLDDEAAPRVAQARDDRDLVEAGRATEAARLASSLRRELQATEEDLGAARQAVADIRPAAGGGTPPTPENPAVSRADLPKAVAEQLGVVRREAHVAEAARMSRAMVGAATHTADLLAAPVQLSPDQVGKIQAVLTEEGEACRKLLETEDRGAEYQKAAGEIIARTETRVRAVLNPGQIKAYERAGVDWWGPGLDYARPGRPRAK